LRRIIDGPAPNQPVWLREQDAVSTPLKYVSLSNTAIMVSVKALRNLPFSAKGLICA
jgi:hypothetical protein